MSFSKGAKASFDKEGPDDYFNKRIPIKLQNGMVSLKVLWPYFWTNGTATKLHTIFKEV